MDFKSPCLLPAEKIWTLNLSARHCTRACKNWTSQESVLVPPRCRQLDFVRRVSQQNLISEESKKIARSSHSRFSLPQTIPPGGPAHGRRRGRGVRGRGTDTGDCTWTAGGLRTHGRWVWLRAGARICTPTPGPRRRLTPRVHLTPRPSKPPGTRSGSTGWCGPLCKGHAQGLGFRV